MPQTIKTSVPFFIMGKDASGKPGAPLANRDRVSVSSADTSSVTVAFDSPAIKDPNGVQSIASGHFTAVVPPKQPNVAITITAQVVHVDGTMGDKATDTVTVATSGGTSGGSSEVAIVIEFGAAS